ncbi:rod shape-determining protein MreC [bacterium]|jgi:rod shape-determining protein MreC|nr:rod shape-determining protein MreC [bacterium]
MKVLNQILIWFFSGALLFFFIHRMFFFRTGVLEQIASCASYPLVIAQNYTVEPVKKIFAKRKNKGELESLVDKLQKSLYELVQENIKLSGQVEYFKDIKELVEFKKRYKHKNAVLGNIILRMVSKQSQVIFVDVGVQSGVEKDMVAIYKNCLLGKVEEVYPYFSRIALITDSQCKVAAFCSKTKSKGICQGVNETHQMELCFVEHFNSLKEGDLILSEGSGFIFPKGFALGKIRSFEKNKLHYNVIVEPLIDFDKIDNCFLIKKGKY